MHFFKNDLDQRQPLLEVSLVRQADCAKADTSSTFNTHLLIYYASQCLMSLLRTDE